MAMRLVITGVLAGVVILCHVPQASAQAGGGGPLKQRIQSKIEAEVAQRKAEAEAQIEEKLASMPNPAEVAEIRQVQTALNFFEFDAGPVDGVMGEQSRTAIEAYQAYLAYPVTGQLTEAEGQFLVGAYQKAQEDPATTQKVAGAHPDGIKGLLLVYRDALAQKGTVAVGVMPTFSVPVAEAALSDRCLKRAEAGPGTIAGANPAPKDSATLALSLAFCAARDVVIAESTAAAARAEGFTPAQIEQQCLGFAPALATLVALLPESPPGDVVSAASAFIERTGQPPEQLAGIAATCLGVGYRTDRMDLAIGSAQILSGLGQATYGELLGHHLALGFGAGPRPDLGLAWFDWAFATGISAQWGADAPDRVAQILAAAKTLNQPNDGSAAATGAAMPSFTVPPTKE